jgi:glycosyltransferase involved in cell wall biosynthesis
MATDVGRSPRARLHAEALRAQGVHVTVIGVAGKPTPLLSQPGVDVVRLPLQAGGDATTVARWAARSALRFGRLGVALARAVNASAPDVMLVMVPPVTPVLDIVALLARTRATPFVVDWHNLEAAMVELRLGKRRGPPSTLVVAAAAAHELAVAQRAALHIGVTTALVEHLRGAGLAADRSIAFDDAPVVRPTAHTTATRAAARTARQLPDGELLVMSSSYSLDDDIDFLAAALTRLAQRRPGLHVLLTGDGPRRHEAVAQLSAIAGLRVLARYIDDDDFVTTLSLCDVAVCVHRSASGLDFPFKVRDAAAAGLASVVLDTGAVVRAGIGRHDIAAATPTAFADAVLQLLDAPATVTVDETWNERWNRIVWPRLERLMQ